MDRGNASLSGWSGAVGQGGQQLWQWTARSIGVSSGHQGQPDAAAQGTESIRAERDGQLHATRSVDIFIVGSFVRFTLTVLMTMFKRLLILLATLLGLASRSEEHTSELQSLMRISYAVFCLKKKKTKSKQSQYQ